MENIIFQIIKSFKTTKKVDKYRYEDFLAHVYETFEKQINSCGTEKIKNKYKKMRTSILEYITSNKEQIISKINKHK